MTAEQAIKILKRDLAIQKEYKALPDSIKALEIAIRSLEIWEQARQMVEQNKDRNIVINYDVVERILMQDILELPSVQPEIVRCKDCKYWQYQQEGVVEE